MVGQELVKTRKGCVNHPSPNLSLTNPEQVTKVNKRLTKSGMKCQGEQGQPTRKVSRPEKQQLAWKLLNKVSQANENITCVHEKAQSKVQMTEHVEFVPKEKV